MGIFSSDTPRIFEFFSSPALFFADEFLVLGKVQSGSFEEDCGEQGTANNMSLNFYRGDVPDVARCEFRPGGAPIWLKRARLESFPNLNGRSCACLVI